jgi:hypothetical protein
MTTTTRRLRLAAAWTGFCIAAGIGIASHMDVPEGAPTTSAVAQASVEDLVAGDNLLLARAGQFVPGTDLTLDQAREVVLAADRVCDGMTAGVPLMDMADTLTVDLGLTDTEAHAFVRSAAQVNC